MISVLFINLNFPMAKPQYCNCKAPTGYRPESLSVSIKGGKASSGKVASHRRQCTAFFSWQYVIGQITENGWAREAQPHHALSPGLKD